MPPPSHQTFEGPNFVICSFCPRKLDFDPEAIPIPYHHSNLQSEEMIYYVDGNFSSRKGIEVGSVTLHPSGLPHGPQPGLAEKSLGMTETHEYAVMCDTFHPLRLTALAGEPPRRPLHVLVGRERVRRRAGRRHLARLGSSIGLLRIAEPYDFELSTERFRVFGPDLANLWHDGALHRVVGGREVRIAAAPGGVDVEPLDARDAAGRREAARPRVRARAFTAWAADSPCSRRAIAARLAGFRPPLAPDPFESLVTSITAQQVSLLAAFAIRSRFIERLGVRAGERLRLPDARAVAGRDRGGARRARLLAAQGRVRDRARAHDARPRRPSRALRRRDPRAGSSRCAGSARGRPNGSSPATSRGRARGRSVDLALRKAVDLFYGCDVHELGPRLDPFQNLSAHYLLTASANAVNDPSRHRRRRGRAARALGGVRGARCPSPRASSPRPGRRSGRRLRDGHAPAGCSSPRTATARSGCSRRRPADGRAHVETVHVRAQARRQGVAKALLPECVRRRAGRARRTSRSACSPRTRSPQAVWRRLGFEPVAPDWRSRSTRSSPARRGAGRRRRAPRPTSRPTTAPSVERAIAQFVPRLERRRRDRRRGGWIRIADPVLDDDREAQARFARDLSDRLGAVVVALALESGAVVRFRLYERGRMVDEYLSVPTFYGDLDRATSWRSRRTRRSSRGSPAPTATRCAGSRGRRRRRPTCRPAAELYDQIARVMGLEP